MQRAQKLRMTGLAGVAVLAVAVPLGAATAGPAAPLLPHRRAAALRAGQGTRTAENHPLLAGDKAGKSGTEARRNGAKPGEIVTKAGERDAKAGGRGAKAVKGAGAAASRRPAGSPAGSPDGLLGGPLDDLGLPLLSGRITHCGPELGSGRGVEAQTCVLTERGRTWARTYYRNVTGGALRAVLTLLRPDGRSSQVNCEVPAADAPGVCETPAGRTVRGDRTGYAAVAEFTDAAGERLLLRSGSNSAADAGSPAAGGPGAEGPGADGSGSG
ncbi:hypothetical protein [Streptomyces sp. NRRL S-337]|uniref:hypothetical protein n=1 Tax=Streptomyces sp. NRRL S-337 TaxID=1463900 RepID=UPI00055CB998|nr:hypothetical protein [Streptomyces sp. NRRL S-337]